MFDTVKTFLDVLLNLLYHNVTIFGFNFNEIASVLQYRKIEILNNQHLKIIVYISI